MSKIFFILSIYFLFMNVHHLHAALKIARKENANTKQSTFYRSIKKDTKVSIHVTGVLGLDEKTNQVLDGGIEKEAEMMFHHIKKILEMHHTSFDKIATFKFYVLDVANGPIIAEVQKKFMNPPYPGQSLMEVYELPMGAHIECEFVAFIIKKFDRSNLLVA